MKNILFILLLALVGYSAFEGWKLHGLQTIQNEYKEDYAEVHRINYGLFNVDLWKDKALNIFGDKLESFEIDPKIYIELDKQVEKYLYDIYKEYFEGGKLIETVLTQTEKNGSTGNKMLLKMFKGSIEDFIKNMDIKSQIPSIAAEVSKELKKNEPTIKKYIRDELDNMLFAGLEESGYKDPREILYNKYQVDDAPSASSLIQERIVTQESAIVSKIKLLYILLILGVIIAALLYKIIGFKYLVVTFTSISIVMLVLGVTLPMIDIDARLNDFNFNILGNQINFDEQVLYFQSKSILDVTRTLLEGHGIDLKIVGLLILMFSIVFPFIKLILSTLYLYVDKVRHSKLARTVIFYLGKWSMADVFVVAMFMAYIGFYGLVTSQLGEIGRNQGGYAVETVNYSRLSPGALFFTSYCILSIITSLIINKVSEMEEK